MSQPTVEQLQRVLEAFCEDAVRGGYTLPRLIYALQSEAATLQRIVNERPEAGQWTAWDAMARYLHQRTEDQSCTDATESTGKKS